MKKSKIFLQQNISQGTDHSLQHDFVLNHIKCALTLLLLSFNMNDSFDIGDGNRTHDCMQLTYLYFKTTDFGTNKMPFV